MTTSHPQHLICCCGPITTPSVHRPGCLLARSEEVATAAAESAPDGCRLLAVVTALQEADLLADLPAGGDPSELMGLLDCLWELGLLGADEEPS